MPSPSSPVTGRGQQERIYRAGTLGRRPAVPVEPARLESAARRRMSRRAWAYVAGGAGAQQTVRANREAFDRWRLVPRHLSGGAQRDVSVDLLGQHFPTPLLLGPVGVLELAAATASLPSPEPPRRSGCRWWSRPRPASRWRRRRRG